MDRIQDTTAPLLFRPGLPRGSGEIRLFYDSTGTAKIEGLNTNDDYRQEDYGILGIGNLHLDEEKIWRVYAGTRNRDLIGNVTFDSGLKLPDHIQQIAIGTTGKHLFSHGAAVWRLGINSTSDKPFNSLDEVGFEAESLYLGKLENGDAYNVGLFWTSFAVYPVPSVSYNWNIERGRSLVIGMPFSFLRWKLNNNWTTSFGAAPILEQANADISYGFGPKYPFGRAYTIKALLTKSSWNSRPVDRLDPDYVLSFQEWRAGIAFNWNIKFYGSFGFETGYSFNRKIREREQPAVFDDGNYHSIRTIEDSYYIRANFKMNLP